MNKNEILNTIKLFVEGNMDIAEFEKICKNNVDFRNFIRGFKNVNLGEKYKNEIINFIDNASWNNAHNQYNLCMVFWVFLDDHSIYIEETKTYQQKYYKLSALIPDWIGDDGFDYVQEKVIDNAPADLSENGKKKWIKDKIKELFRYEIKRPYFAQGGSWPLDDDDKPLVFRKQKSHGEKITYTFVNPKTNEEVEVEEYY